MIDYESELELMNPRAREVFFLLAVSNSCIDPIIYEIHLNNYLEVLEDCRVFRMCSRPVQQRQQAVEMIEMINLNVPGANIEQQGQNDLPVLATSQQSSAFCETAV